MWFRIWGFTLSVFIRIRRFHPLESINGSCPVCGVAVLGGVGYSLSFVCLGVFFVNLSYFKFSVIVLFNVFCELLC